MKTDNPFLTKIIFEEQYCQDEWFSVVKDIEPIVDGHYMIYSRECHLSLADCDYRKMVPFIQNIFAKKAGVPYAYFERGRASFCTSMQGVKHGHGHLVPCFSSRMDNIFPYGRAERFGDLAEAYQNTEKEGQYLIWGNLSGPFYVINSVEEIPKRAIRNTIQDHTEQ